MAATDAKLVLVCRAGALLCALPVEQVIETLRPLPVEALPEAPAFIAGSCVVHGKVVPVVVLSRLLGAETMAPTRLVVVRAGDRQVGLAVDAVIGFRDLADELNAALPPLLSGAGRAAVASLGTLDRDLAVTLETARLVSDEVFAALDTRASAA